MKTDISAGEWEFYEQTGSIQGESSSYGIKAPPPKHWIIPPLNINQADVRLMSESKVLLDTLEGLHKALSRMIDKHDPDSIEAEWLSHSHAVICKAKGIKP